jgi:hypothetical protein
MPPLPFPLFAPHRELLRYAVNTGLRNSKEGPHDLSDVTRNNTQHAFSACQMLGFIRKTEGSAVAVKYEQFSTVVQCSTSPYEDRN